MQSSSTRAAVLPAAAAGSGRPGAGEQLVPDRGSGAGRGAAQSSGRLSPSLTAKNTDARDAGGKHIPQLGHVDRADREGEEAAERRELPQPGHASLPSTSPPSGRE